MASSHSSTGAIGAGGCRGTGFEHDVNPWPDNPMGHDAADAKYRFQWTFPIVVSPHDPGTL